MKLSVIIVNYNVRDFLFQCLSSVLKSSIETEIFVVDNNSPDDSCRMLKKHFPQVRLIENKENVGFSTANNQAIKQSTGEYVLLLNPDTVIGEKTLENVCHFMDKTADAGGLGVKMINKEGVFLPESKRSLPTAWISFCKITGLTKLFPKSKIFGKYSLLFLDENKMHKVEVLAGAFMLLRRKALDKVGLLDEQFFMYGEDIDLSYRLTLGGYKNYYLPEKIIHYKGESTAKDSLRYVKVFYESMQIFYRKHQKTNIIFSFFVETSIWFRASLAVLARLLKKILPKRIKRKKTAVVFDTDKMTFEEIISTMDKLSGQHEFYISDKKNNLLI